VQQGNLPTDPTSRFFVGAGFIATPSAFVDKTGVHAGLVGTTPDGVVLALRGTLSFDFHNRLSLRDWVNDLAFRPVRPDWLPAGSTAGVHEGFLRALEDLVGGGLQTAVSQQLQAAGPDTKLLITGHSKGGGVAPLAAVRFLTTARIPSEVVTFAAPHAGDAAFADLYTNAAVVHTRYEFQDDIVPHVPVAIGGILAEMDNVPFVGSLLPGLVQYDYEPIGALRFIDWSNQIVADGKSLQVLRLAHLTKIVLAEQWSVFKDDHRISCVTGGGGYMPIVCPVGVCP
jgi:hypothetical protein